MAKVLQLSSLALLIAFNVNAATVDLRVMETSDIHSNLVDFDYYKDKPCLLYTSEAETVHCL